VLRTGLPGGLRGLPHHARSFATSRFPTWVPALTTRTDDVGYGSHRESADRRSAALERRRVVEAMGSFYGTGRTPKGPDPCTAPVQQESDHGACLLPEGTCRRPSGRPPVPGRCGVRRDSSPTVAGSGLPKTAQSPTATPLTCADGTLRRTGRSGRDRRTLPLRTLRSPCSRSTDLRARRGRRPERSGIREVAESR
jgi:hypothetical protein